MTLRSFYLFFFVFLFLTACAETELISHAVKNLQIDKGQGNTSYKIGNAYKIDGKKYYPRESFDLEETGIASWYGPNFHGKLTANGEIFDQNQLTAAHRTLQIPSIIQVTNLENGRTITVRVNDRGPFSKGRILDLSKRGAELLGFKNQGTARIKLKVLSRESRLVAQAAIRGEKIEVRDLAANIDRSAKTIPSDIQATPSLQPIPVKQVETVKLDNNKQTVVNVVPIVPTNLYVQAGAFSIYNNAIRLSKRLEEMGTVTISQVSVKNQVFYRVRIGPLKTVEEADTILNRIWNEKNIYSAHIIVE